MDSDSNYIQLNNFLREHLKGARKEKGLQSVKFSKALNKSGSWLSLVESGKISKLTKDDFFNIFKYLMEDAKKEDLNTYIENLLVEASKLESENNIQDTQEEDMPSKPNKLKDKNKKSSPVQNEEPNKKIVFYGKNNNDLARIGYNKAMDDTIFSLDRLFKSSPDDALKATELLAKNLENDIGFMVGLTSLPFYLLEKHDIKTKEILFNEISDLLQKYLDKD